MKNQKPLTAIDRLKRRSRLLKKRNAHFVEYSQEDLLAQIRYYISSGIITFDEVKEALEHHNEIPY